MLSGIATASSRQVTDHVRTLKTRSIFNPAPISAMMTTNSVNRSAISGKRVGSGWSVTCGREKRPAPRTTQTIGRDSGSRRSASGSHATRAISRPRPVRTII